MTLSPRIAVPIAILGSSIATAFSLLHYAQTHRSSSPGGHLALIIGAAVVGLLCGAGSHWASPPERRSGVASIAIGVISAIATGVLLLAILIWSYGS